jgi:hypothetical protein
MIYLSAQRDGQPVSIVILESGNLEKLKEGSPCMTPDGRVLIAWTPDIEWLRDQILASDGHLDKIADAIAESAKRPQTAVRGSRTMEMHTFGGRRERGDPNQSTAAPVAPAGAATDVGADPPGSG